MQARSKIKEVKKLLASSETTGAALEEALPQPKAKFKGRPTRRGLEAPEQS